MNIGKQIINSIYNKDFYESLLEADFKYSLFYYLKLIAILSLFLAVALGFFITPKLVSDFKKLDQMALDYIPADLVVEIENGVASSSKEYYVVPLPEEERKSYDNINNLLIIDINTATSTREYISSTSTLFLLTKGEVAYFDPEREITEVISLARVDDLKFSRESVSSLVETIRPWYFLVGPILVLLTFIASFIALLLNLIILLVQAVFSFFLLRIMKVRDKTGSLLGFFKSYQLTLHAVTLPLLLSLIGFSFGIGSHFIFLLILVLVILYINLCPCLKDQEVKEIK